MVWQMQVQEVCTADARTSELTDKQTVRRIRKEKGERQGEKNEDRTKGGGQRRNRYDYGLTIHLSPDMSKIFHPKHLKKYQIQKIKNKYNNMKKSINEKSRSENLTLPFHIINLTDQMTFSFQLNKIRNQLILFVNSFYQTNP